MIEVESLRKHFGAHVAVGGIDFTIERGEVVGFLGPNGAGKSTTMKIITGFLSPTAGTARVAGLDVVADPVGARRRIGYLPEAAPVYPDMRVDDYLAFVGEVRGLARSERANAIERALTRCGLLDRRRQVVGTLSKGYKQRVGLAQAVLHDPDILILDEPTSGLDPNQIVDIRKLIREIGEKKTVILSTHILSEVQASCDRVLIINNGALVADGPTSEVTAVSSGEVVRAAFIPGDVRQEDAVVVAALEALEGVSTVRVLPHAKSLPDELVVQLQADRDVREAVFRAAQKLGVVLVELRREKSNLEDVFRRLTVGVGARGDEVAAARG
ncbi:MAG: ATP-binding cassette domain-containing protein [Proteobacteria bacterium]|nr:ATP-binding cassette domain-containing protein [Pseudomonadota bacterium]MCP4916715.1 ATP-binding cassette domain-containing protein [Pseudomonadota bacterium]